MKSRRAVIAIAATAALGVGAVMSATSVAAGGTILIGSIAGTSGAYGSTGVAMQNGAQMAVDDLNAKGGALGKTFKLQGYNDQASATLAVAALPAARQRGSGRDRRLRRHRPSTAAMADRLHIPDIGAVDDAGHHDLPERPAQPAAPVRLELGPEHVRLRRHRWRVRDQALQAAWRCCTTRLLRARRRGGDQARLGRAGKKLALDDAITEDWSSGATVGLTNEIDKIKASKARASSSG